MPAGLNRAQGLLSAAISCGLPPRIRRQGTPAGSCFSIALSEGGNLSCFAHFDGRRYQKLAVATDPSQRAPHARHELGFAIFLAAASLVPPKQLSASVGISSGLGSYSEA